MWKVALTMGKTLHTAYLALIISTSLMLSSCQVSTGYKQLEKAPSANDWSGKIHSIPGEVNIACVGTYHCEIIRIDKTLIISPETHQPIDSKLVVSIPDPDDKALVNNHSVKIVPLSTSGISGLTNYYARAKPIKREVQVDFYPENNLRYVERFTIIHEFKAATYQLRAYSMKSDEDEGSLLDNASPNPLCVELIEDGKIERRFCKQANNEPQGEFIETGVFD